MNNYNIYMGLIFPPVDQLAAVEDLFRLLLNYKAIAPRLCGEVEPLRERFDAEHLGLMAARAHNMPTFYWKSERNIAGGALQLRSGQGRQTGDLNIWVDLDRLENPDILSRMFCDIAMRFAAIFGYIQAL